MPRLLACIAATLLAAAAPARANAPPPPPTTPTSADRQKAFHIRQLLLPWLSDMAVVQTLVADPEGNAMLTLLAEWKKTTSERLGGAIAATRRSGGGVGATDVGAAGGAAGGAGLGVFSGVQVHDAASLKSLLATGTKVALEMYSPQCPHCVRAAAPYEEFAQSVKGSDDLIVARVDCKTPGGQPVCHERGARGFPTFQLLTEVEGKVTEAVPKFSGKRTGDAFKAWATVDSLEL